MSGPPSLLAVVDAPTPSRRRSASSAAVESRRSPKKRYSVPRSSACGSCRAARARCSHERPRCDRCKKHSLSCVYERESHGAQVADDGDNGGKVSRALGGPSASPSPLDTASIPSGNDRLASRLELTKLLTAFYTHVYHVQAMSFIHRAQLFRQVEQGQASPIVVRTICGLSARYLPGADQNHLEGGDQAALWISEAKAALIADTNRFSMSKLAATLCILQHELNCGRTGSAWMFVALAARMALAMGLNVEPAATDMPWIEREQRRRLMWATCCADSFCSSGWPEYSLLSAVELKVFLPSDETSFLLGTERPGVLLSDVMDAAEEEGHSLVLDPGVSANLLARWIWLTKLRDELLDYVRRVSQHTIKPWEANSPFLDVVRRLRRWRDTLPPSLELTVDNLYARQATHELDALVTLHLCFESIHSTLYRFTLPNFTESARADFLMGAPREWIQQVRCAACVRATAVTRHLELLEKHFPDHIPTTKLFNLYIFNSIQVQLQYHALQAVDHGPDADRDATTMGFQTMVHVVGKMTNYFWDNRRLLRDTLRILTRHGYDVDHEWGDRLGVTSGSRTPNEVAGTLSGIPSVPARHSDDGHVHVQMHDSLSAREQSVDLRPGATQERSNANSSDPISEATRSSWITTVANVVSSGPSEPPYAVPGTIPAVSLQGPDERDFQVDHISPSDYLNRLISGSSFDPLASLSSFWEPSDSFGGSFDINSSMTGPAHSFADMAASTWTAETNDFFWDIDGDANHGV